MKLMWAYSHHPYENPSWKGFFKWTKDFSLLCENKSANIVNNTSS